MQLSATDASSSCHADHRIVWSTQNYSRGTDIGLWMTQSDVANKCKGAVERIIAGCWVVWARNIDAPTYQNGNNYTCQCIEVVRLAGVLQPKCQNTAIELGISISMADRRKTCYTYRDKINPPTPRSKRHVCPSISSLYHTSSKTPPVLLEMILPSYPHCAISKLVPHPQLLCAPGIPVTLNWLPINSIV